MILTNFKISVFITVAIGAVLGLGAQAQAGQSTSPLAGAEARKIFKRSEPGVIRRCLRETPRKVWCLADVIIGTVRAENETGEVIIETLSAQAWVTIFPKGIRWREMIL
jgi:hypothetical protein